MEEFDGKQMDAALEGLLKRASDPAIPEGAEARLMAAVRLAEQQTNVVKFQPRPKIHGWAVGLPLAASLALGIYLGSRDTFEAYFPDSMTGEAAADLSDSTLSTGLDDAESYAEGESK
jgi:hypothetical protein